MFTHTEKRNKLIENRIISTIQTTKKKRRNQSKEKEAISFPLTILADI